ncbi:helix-turn-helix domain-containing protein [Amycolatopsis sp. NPDC003865]
MTVMQTETDALVQLGETVRDAREARGWSIKLAASRGGGDQRSWSTVEKGRPVKPTTYRNLATAFGIDAELITNAADSADALPELVTALRAVVEAPSTEGAAAALAEVDPADLDDARLLALLRACADELEARLASRAGRLDVIEEALRAEREVKRPTAERISQQITSEIRKGTP